MNKTFTNILSIIAGLGAVLALLFTGMEVIAFDVNRYEKAYEKYDRYEYIGISKTDLRTVTEELLLYMKGDREDLVMYAQINGQKEMVFQDREQAHMVDVLKLFLGGIAIRNYSVRISLISIIALFVILKKRSIKYLARGYLISCGFVMTIFIAIGIYAVVDFSSLFWNFHLLFFDNDLWILDGATDIMIQMFPEAFFNEMALAIGATCTVFVLTPAVAAIVYLRKLKNKEIKQ